MPAGAVGVYAVLASLWIVVSDGAPARTWGNLEAEWLASSMSGPMFVAVTSLIFHALIRRRVERVEAAETALRTSDERRKFALEGSGEGVWDWDGATGKGFGSARWKAMFGHTETDIGDRPHEGGLARAPRGPEPRAVAVFAPRPRQDAGVRLRASDPHEARGEYRGTVAVVDQPARGGGRDARRDRHPE